MVNQGQKKLINDGRFKFHMYRIYQLFKVVLLIYTGEPYDYCCFSVYHLLRLAAAQTGSEIIDWAAESFYLFYPQFK